MSCVSISCCKPLATTSSGVKELRAKRRNIIHENMRPVGRKDRSIDRFEVFLVEYPVRMISVAVVERCVCIILVFFFVLSICRRTNVNCNKGFWRLCPDELSGYVKAQAFSI